MSVGEARTPELGAWSSTAAGEPFGEWELPGMGEAAPSCGRVSARAFCDAHGHIDYRRHDCGRRECPACWSRRWAGPRTVNVVSRLAAARYVEPDGLDRRTVHVAVSPPEDSINTIEAFYGGRREALEIAKDHGVRGGVVIAHGYRAIEETIERFREENPERGLWWWIRDNDRPWDDQVYWSPHYHVIGLARDVEPGGADRDGGWIFENIRSLAPYEGLRDRDAYNDMAGVVRYLLSHATFPAYQDRQAVTWYGDLHGTNFNPTEELSGGAFAVIERVAEEVVGAEAELEEEEEIGAGREECPVDDCEGYLHDIWHARRFLSSAAGQELTRDERERVRVAYEWVAGYVHPPPGLKRPQTIEQAEESLEHLLSAQ